LVLTSLKATLNIVDRCHVYVPEIETGRHVKNNACTVEIKIKCMIRKHYDIQKYIPGRYIYIYIFYLLRTVFIYCTPILTLVYVYYTYTEDIYIYIYTVVLQKAGETSTTEQNRMKLGLVIHVTIFFQ
jgi:hypothetical protein